ncbi:helix-turn-helix transcriptional regulator [Brucella grignonensis]|uniref:HTH-type quorum sensing-dependent transcriptional regulator VjbR n=1 Tax=Brucella grignonensis TaxID=94627 RepID=A0A256GAZ2_9HYPH|nr:LuxR family transcriptional regulator [Brucella grignonensis]OYR24110.1 autoinducer binding domain protein [Brucella grignonensis]
METPEEVNAGKAAASLKSMYWRAAELGFHAVIYDYSPIRKASPIGEILPSFVHTEGMPSSFEDFWIGKKFYSIDQVQRHCIESLAPFKWSLADRCEIAGERRWAAFQRPAFGYLLENRLNCGVSVPLRSRNGALHTFTAIRVDADRDFDSYCAEHIWKLVRVAFDNLPTLDKILTIGFGSSGDHPLTEREIACLTRFARGSTPKQIAGDMGRSLPTVRFHLYNACRKLHGRNLAHATAIAVERGIIAIYDQDSLIRAALVHG